MRQNKKPIKPGQSGAHMKDNKVKFLFCRKCWRIFTVIILAATTIGLGLQPKAFSDDITPGGGHTNSQPSALEAWTFQDNVYWTSDRGYAPVSFTNLNFSYLGDGASLVVNSNVPARLQYNAIEGDGTTNLTVDIGSITFWFAPNWASTNVGGSGPGEWGRLIEVGGYSPDSSYGLWSIYVDDVGQNIYFSAQTNDLSSNLTTYVSAPISWTTNYWHYIALTYSTTNTDLYLDGILATSGPPITIYPGPDVLANGFYMGSDSNGVLQAQGMFNNVYTYNLPVDGGVIQEWFYREYGFYIMNPWNAPYMNGLKNGAITALAVPTTISGFDVMTGQGNLQLVGTASSCVDGTTADQVWITNVTVTAASTKGNKNVTFTIEGGAPGVPYDVFANSVLSFGPSGVPWTWMGKGYQCNIYTLTNLPSTACFLILGTPQNSAGEGLTDAYELLVQKIDPSGSQFDTNGVPYAWYAENGIAAVGNADPDCDALVNYKEYQFGTLPQVSEGFSVWTTTSNSSIP